MPGPLGWRDRSWGLGLDALWLQHLSCCFAWPRVFRGLPCPWAWSLFPSNQAATLHLTSFEAGGLQGQQGARVYLHCLCLFIAVALMRPELWLGLGGCPTKTAFRPHSAGKLGAKAG